MSFLEWILFCVYWQTHKKYEFWLKTVADDPETKHHVQLGGDWIDDDDLEKWSIAE